MKEVTWMKQGHFNAGTPEATEGERSEPKEAGGVPGVPDPEVPAKATRHNINRGRKPLHRFFAKVHSILVVWPGLRVYLEGIKFARPHINLA